MAGEIVETVNLQVAESSGESSGWNLQVGIFRLESSGWNLQVNLQVNLQYYAATGHRLRFRFGVLVDIHFLAGRPLEFSRDEGRRGVRAEGEDKTHGEEEDKTHGPTRPNLRHSRHRRTFPIGGPFRFRLFRRLARGPSGHLSAVVVADPRPPQPYASCQKCPLTTSHLEKPLNFTLVRKAL